MILLLQSLLVFFYAASVLSLGAFLLKRLLPGFTVRDLPVPPLALAATALLLGEGVLAFVWLGLSLAGYFAPKLVLLIVLASLVLGGSTALAMFRNAWRQLREIARGYTAMPTPWTCLAIMALLMFLALCMNSLAGPVVIGSDASSFYMVLPKITAASHKLLPTTDYVAKHSTFGFLGEMHFAALMSLGASTASKAFSFVTGLALTALLAGMASLAGVGRRGQLIVLIILLSSTAFTNYICDGKIDVYSATFGVAAAYWVMQTGRLPDRPVLLIAGLLLGWSIYAKLSLMGALAPPLAILLVWRKYQALGEPGFSWEFVRWATFMLFGIGALTVLPILVLMIKNYIFFQEPFAPVFWFSKSWGTWFAVRRYTAADVRHLLMTYPLALTLGKYHAQGGTLSPLFLILAPLAFLVPKPRKLSQSPVFQIGAAALFGLILWVCVFPSGIGVRFILPTLLLLAIPIANACEYVLTREGRPRWISLATWAALVIVPVFLLYDGYKYYRGPLHFVKKMQDINYTGRQSLERDHPVVYSLRMINRLAKPGERVFMAMIYRYWLDSDLLQCLPTEQEWTTMLAHKTTPQKAWTYLFERGIRFVFYDSLTHDMYFQKRLGLEGDRVVGAPAWLKVKRIYHQDRWSVYEIESIDPGRKPKVVCGQKKPPLWQAVPGPVDGFSPAKSSGRTKVGN